jgi:hypothetical protein
MRWNRTTVQPFLDVRTVVLNEKLADAFRYRYPGFRSVKLDQRPRDLTQNFECSLICTSTTSILIGSNQGMDAARSWRRHRKSPELLVPQQTAPSPVDRSAVIAGGFRMRSHPAARRATVSLPGNPKSRQVFHRAACYCLQ